MKEKLRHTLNNRQKLRNIDTGLKSAAVLIPIYDNGGEYIIVFTKRSQHVKVHKGEISFPGGTYEERDAVLLNTALRECGEEIGLDARDVDVLGEIDDFQTIGSRYRISPFVAHIPWPYAFQLDSSEVDSILEVPVRVLLDKANFSSGEVIWQGMQIPPYSYRYKDDVIWGASARILNQFLGVWNALMSN